MHLCSVISVDDTSIPDLVDDNQKNKKPLDMKKILTAAGAVVVVIALILGGMAMFANKNTDNVYVCYSDGKYKLVTDMKKADSLHRLHRLQLLQWLRDGHGQQEGRAGPGPR